MQALFTTHVKHGYVCMYDRPKIVLYGDESSQIWLVEKCAPVWLSSSLTKTTYKVKVDVRLWIVWLDKKYLTNSTYSYPWLITLIYIFTHGRWLIKIIKSRTLVPDSREVECLLHTPSLRLHLAGIFCILNNNGSLINRRVISPL